MWADPRIHSGSLPLFVLVFKMIPSAGAFSAQLHKLPDGLSKRDSPPLIPSAGGIRTFKACIRCGIFRLVSKYTKSSYSSAKLHLAKSAKPSSGCYVGKEHSPLKRKFSLLLLFFILDSEVFFFYQNICFECYTVD